MYIFIFPKGFFPPILLFFLSLFPSSLPPSFNNTLFLFHVYYSLFNLLSKVGIIYLKFIF